MSQGQEVSIQKGIKEALDSHGYAFQHALIKHIVQLVDRGDIPFTFRVAEFPIQLNGFSTHIDFILEHRDYPFYLVAECKRSDPSRSNWCFVKAPFVTSSIRGQERIVRECVLQQQSLVLNDTQGLLDPAKVPLKIARGYVALQSLLSSKDIFRYAFPLKSEGKGDTANPVKAFSEAVKQVTLGVNGLVSLCLDDRGLLTDNGFVHRAYRVINPEFDYAAFLPVIFTTANLWTSEADLSAADLKSGKLGSDQLDLKPVTWLIYHEAQSPALKHPLAIRSKDYKGVTQTLYREYTRTICVVTPDGLQDFIRFIDDEEEWHYE